MLTRPFTRLIVAFGIRKITQRRLAEEFVTGILILIPFGIIIGFVTSRICTKIHFSTTSKGICSFFNIRSDVWTTIVVFLIGDILMEWLLPSLGCLPIPAGERIAAGVVGLSSSTSGSSSSSAAASAANAMVAMMTTDDGDTNGDNDDYVTNILNGIENENKYIESTFYQEDEYHYTMRWVLQSYGLYCPINFANSNSLLTPDATAILFSIRLLFLCIGVHIGESCGSFVALTGGIATGKSTAAQMFVNYNNNDTNDNENEDDDNDNDTNNATATAGGSSSNNNSWWYWWGRNNAFSTAFLFSDDGYNEGTVQLICADSIAHSILLPPEMLAANNNRQGENKHKLHSGDDDSSEQEDDDDNDVDDENNTSNDADNDDADDVSVMKSKSRKGRIRRHTKWQNERWDKMFQRLVAYKKERKSTNVPQYYKEDPKLASWVHRQRAQYTNKEISVKRIRNLESTGFVWKLKEQFPWEEMYQRLVAYKKKHKSTYVPRKYAADLNLGQWVNHQRRNYSKKNLSIERINRLDSICFVWDAFDAKWMKMYSKLVEYKKQNKSTRVPHYYTEDPSFGIWVHNQRFAYYNKGKLSGKRLKLLNSINFAAS